MFSWILPFQDFSIEKMEILNQKTILVTKKGEIFLDFRTFVVKSMVFKKDQQ